MDTDIDYMKLALAEARAAMEAGEVPVGALVVIGGEAIARAGNGPIAGCDPSAHAEMLAIRRAAARIGNYRLTGATLYVTLEPCLMCAGAVLQARIPRLVFGAADPKAGAIVSLYKVAADSRLNHSFQVRGGVLAEESALLLKDFFQIKRNANI